MWWYSTHCTLFEDVNESELASFTSYLVYFHFDFLSCETIASTSKDEEEAKVAVRTSPPT